VPLTDAVDGFRLAYDDHSGPGATVVLLHGWPGDRHDHRALVPLLAGQARVLVPDLRGFGETQGSAPEPAAYAADAQARSVIALIEAAGGGPAMIGGYDVGSRVAQAVAAARPDLVRALVISPPLPGAGKRVLEPERVQEFWYQAFHQLRLVEDLIDGRPDAARAYLRHFWTHWSGPAFVPDEAELDRLGAAYGRPGAFAASVNWYRAGAGMVARSVAEQVPATRLTARTVVLWPEHDPLFPRVWSDRLDEFLADVTLHPLDGAGHFTPLEAPEAFAAAILDQLRA
jgi:pimeloyl-ACP methyl ester carboxylesterase